MENGESMIKLTPGYYWFHGYSLDNSHDEKKFNKMLDSLGIRRDRWRFGTGSGEGSSIYHFFIDSRGILSDVLWVSSTDLEKIENIKNTSIQLDYRNFDIDYSKCGKIIELERGKTKCDETCIFYLYCDGERESSFNPSNAVGNCSEYILNKNEVQVK